eukprot:1814066-Rhodomonas_salina.1
MSVLEQAMQYEGVRYSPGRPPRAGSGAYCKSTTGSTSNQVSPSGHLGCNGWSTPEPAPAAPSCPAITGQTSFPHSVLLAMVQSHWTSAPPGAVFQPSAPNLTRPKTVSLSNSSSALATRSVSTLPAASTAIRKTTPVAIAAAAAAGRRRPLP